MVLCSPGVWLRDGGRITMQSSGANRSVWAVPCGVQEGRSEPVEKWAAWLVLQQPICSSFLLPSSCSPSFLQCPGTTPSHGHSQLLSLLRRGTWGSGQTKGAGTDQPLNGPGSSQASCEAGRAGWALLAHDTAAFDVRERSVPAPGCVNLLTLTGSAPDVPVPV